MSIGRSPLRVKVTAFPLATGDYHGKENTLKVKSSGGTSGMSGTDIY